MIKTVPEITYRDLDAALTQIGYQREDLPDRRIYRHPSDADALIPYPLLPLGDPVREYHLIAARQIADGFGIMDASAFDLLLLRVAHSSPVPA